MSMLTVFNFESNEVRVVLVDGEPWFVGKDVAEILGYSNTADAVRQHCDQEDTLSDIELTRKLRELSQSDFAIVNRAIYINESGVYSLIFGSTKPEAKAFKKWVTSEVLPSIRKTGSYSVVAPTVQQSTLPSEVKALNVAKAVDEIQNLLSHSNPRLAQFLVDHAISDIMYTQNTLTGSRFKGVVEIAEELGFKVSFNNRSQLGKFVKKLCGDLAQSEERLVNGTSRKVACYPEDSEEVRQAIFDFFNR